MTLKKIVLLFVTGLLLFSLSACAQVNEELWINKDGSGKIHYDIGISEAILSMGGQDSNTLNGDELFKEKGVDNTNPYLKNAVTKQSSDSGMRHYTMDADVTDFSKLFNNSASEESGLTYSIEKLPNGNYKFQHIIDLDKMNKQDTESNTDQYDMSGIMAGVMADRYWTVTLHSDQIVSTNGNWDKDNKVVVWKIPMSQMMTGKGQIEMTTEYRTGLPLWLIAGIGIAVIILLVAAAVVVSLVTKNRKAEIQTPIVPPTDPEI